MNVSGTERRAARRTETYHMEEKDSNRKRMDCQGKKNMPKRARIPPKKMRLYEPDCAPKDDQDAVFVFLTFEDGCTSKIFNICDVLNKNEKPITGFRDLKPGDVVLARWSDNKFYNATVDYIGTADKTVDARKGSKKDIKKRDAAAERFYNLQSLPQAIQSTSAQPNPNLVECSAIYPPPTQSSPPPGPQHQPSPTQSSPPPEPQHQPPPTQSSPPPGPQHQPPPTQSSPPSGPQHLSTPNFSSPSPWPQHQPPPTQSSPLPGPQHQSTPNFSSPSPWPQHQSTPTQSFPPPWPQYQPLSTQPLDFSCPLPITLGYSHPQYPQPHAVQRMPPDQLQQRPILVDLDQQPKSTTPNNLTAKESFLRMMYSPSVHTEESQASTSGYQSSLSSESLADTIIIERDPLPEYGEPCVQIESTEGRAWKPCKACQAEVAKLIEAKGKLEDVLCSISVGQLEALQGFLDKVGKINHQAGVVSTRRQSGKQELYQDSGLFLSPTRFAAIHADARKDCLRLFHLLFDEFFTAEECQNAVAFGKHGKVPEGKAVLDKSKVDGILTYIMRCGSLEGWTPVEKAKVKKALINKCRQRVEKT